MPNFKKEKIRFQIDSGLPTTTIDVDIKIDSGGDFYCYVDEEYELAASAAFKGVCLIYKNNGKVKGKIKVEAETYSKLKSCLYNMLDIHCKPEITEEYVIRYNIESHVSFAADKQGNIFPNAGYKGAKWADINDEGMYGKHHSASPSEGGYSLTIGAEALVKKTISYGGKCNIEYDHYYKDGDHHGHDNPAEILNSWCSLRLPENAKEMPYTDEAAMFFHNLMLGMARLSKLIQESTFDEKKLMKCIESNLPLLEKK